MDAGYHLDVAGGQLTWNGLVVVLGGQQLRLAGCLAAANGRTVPRETLWRQITENAEMKIVDVVVCKLRALLRAKGIPDPIITVWGRGLCWRPDVTLAGATFALVPPEFVGELHALLGSHRDRGRAEAVHHAIFGV